MAALLGLDGPAYAITRDAAVGFAGLELALTESGWARLDA